MPTHKPKHTNRSRTKKKQNTQGWPYYRLFIPRQILESRILEMRKLKFKISNQPRKPIALNLKTNIIQPTFKGKYTTFVDENYLKYDILPLIYSEPELLKCKFRGQTAPITQYATRANKLWQEFQAKQLRGKRNKTLKKQSTSRIPQTQILSEYREFLYSKIKACNNYRPTLALQTYEFLGSAKSVLDFSAGWGDRLFAACVGKIKYIGLDPNTNNRGIYDTIIRNHGSHDQQRVITTGAEYLPDTTLKSMMSELGIPEFDLIATSPPFYDYEVYSAAAQSAMGFIDAPRWLIFWLGHVVYKYIPFLRPGGYLALYIQDTDQNSFVEPLTLFILSNPTLFSNLECCGIINSTRFPMVVFQKPKSYPSITSKSFASSETQKYQNLLRTNYPTHAKLAELWLTTHTRIQDINTDSLTRTVIKYLINKTGQQVNIPNTQAYINLAEEFQTHLQQNTTPDKLDKLFIDLWRESIQEYKLIFGQTPETNIHPPEYREIYTKLFKSS